MSNTLHIRLALLLAMAGGLSSGPAHAQEGAREEFEPIVFGDPVDHAYDKPFFAPTEYDEAITHPDEILGQVLGSRLSRHAEILTCFRRWAGQSDRVSMEVYARSHEGRELIWMAITSPANQGKLKTIRANLARLADPRGLTKADAAQLVANTPPVAWMGYGIHGDEPSGCDAALALGYHLIAGKSKAVSDLLDKIVVVIDPCMNPDGRQRLVTQVEQHAGRVANLDHASMQRGRWPEGRGNHYYFDMNRDWIAGTQPETRGRWQAIQLFNPQLLVDAHEMGALDTYLFYPQSEPHNPFLPAKLNKWQIEFSADQAKAFDVHKWGYYTREWADAWGPFYSDSWGSLLGAVGILHEQSGNSGFALRRASGRVMTYREAVHHQVVSSIANVTTLKSRAREILADFLEHKRANVGVGAGQKRDFIMVPGSNRDRERAFLNLALAQGFEVFKTRAATKMTNAVDTLAGRHATLVVPAGSYVIPARQPRSPLVKSYLSFDVRVPKSALLMERESLERKGESKMYDATAWSLAHAFDLQAYWCDSATVARDKLVALPADPENPELVFGESVAAWAVDGSDDASVRFAARAMEHGLAVQVADKAFAVEGRAFPRGSVLVQRHENKDDVAAIVRRAAKEAGTTVHPARTGRAAGDGPDLGGQHFKLLHRPRVALLGNTPVSTTSHGHIWHLLDTQVGLPLSKVDALGLGSTDLRRFNVLIVPSGGVGDILKSNAESLRNWVKSGGTLIASGGSAAAICDKEMKLGTVILRRDALEDLAIYNAAAEREKSARTITIDEAELYGPKVAASSGKTSAKTESKTVSAKGKTEGDEKESAEKKSMKIRDKWQQRFAPSGVFLRALVNENAWITSGCGPEMPVYFSGSRVFLAKSPVTTAIRLEEAKSLRVAGLLWPEARERIEKSAYLTVERVGKGQIILFATEPGHRGQQRATARMIANAVVYGPGLGANPPIEW